MYSDVMKYLLTILLFFTPIKTTLGNDGTTYLTGAKLLEFCEVGLKEESTEAKVKFGACVFYIASINDLQGTYYEWWNIQKYFCKPDSIDTIQLAELTTKYLKNHPEALVYSASSAVMWALREAFPCE